MENLERYKHLNSYLKEKFGERTLKICVDGGFTCPNRDGSLSSYGCIFCSEKGSGEHLKSTSNFKCNIDDICDSIKSQISNHLNSYKGQRANKFIVYFQNYTNTYDTIENLKKKYDSALIDNKIVGIQIATRPDCINEDVVKLLKTYTDKYYVCVELGLQTSNNEIGKIINRCYISEDFSNAVNLLNKYNIDIVTHIMVGLPFDNFENIKNTVKFINSHNIQGLKIHNVYVVKNTKLCNMYENGLYTPIDFESYIEYLVYIITHINPQIIIHRISGDAPKDLLVAPSWNIHKKWVLNGLDKALKDKNLYQGIYFENLE